MVKVYIETYGCTLNKADSLSMKKALTENNHQIVDNAIEADVIIINTCIVRYDTEVKMFKRINQLLGLGKKLIVAGCMSKVYPYKIKSINNSISLLSPQAINCITRIIDSREPLDILNHTKNFDILPEEVDGVIATIPIAEGCLDECSFCVVKISRPHLISVPIEKVIDCVKNVISKGAIEIEITAQDLAVYGYDLYGRYMLSELLEKILELEEDNFIIRLGQMNPRHITHFLDNLISILKDPRIYKHLHIPIQSGDNRVLAYMGRGHSIELFIDIVKELRNKIEGIHIATDIIVGHPGEDDEAFAQSVKLITEHYIDRVHIARFSPRPQTKATLMQQIPDPVKKARSSYIEKVYEAVALNLNTEYIGSIAKVWITEIDKVRERAIGRLYNYRPVVLDVGRDALGKKAYVRIQDATFYDLRGKIVSYIA